jgi:hypothetical protein
MKTKINIIHFSGNNREAIAIVAVPMDNPAEDFAPPGMTVKGIMEAEITPSDLFPLDETWVKM